MQLTKNNIVFFHSHASLKHLPQTYSTATKTYLFILAIFILLAMPHPLWASPCDFSKGVWESDIQALQQFKRELGKAEEKLRRAVVIADRADSVKEREFSQSNKIYLEIKKIDKEIDEKERLKEKIRQTAKFPVPRIEEVDKWIHDALVRIMKLRHAMEDLESSGAQRDAINKGKAAGFIKQFDVDYWKENVNSQKLAVETSKKEYLRCLEREKASKLRKGLMTLQGCVFHQVKLSNYRKGLHGMPGDIPKVPAFVFGETAEHSSGRHFSMGSKQSPSALKSWYRRQLPDNGWSILLDDTIKTRFGPIERLFAKSRKTCVSIVIANAPAGMSHKSVVGIYTFPGSGKFKAPDAKSKE